MIMKEGSGEPVWSELTRSFEIDFFCSFNSQKCVSKELVLCGQYDLLQNRK